MLTSRAVLTAATAAVALVAATGFIMSSATADAEALQLPACPQVFSHGGYPTGPNPWERDKIRQANNPTAMQADKNAGASGMEADLQLTKDGTKAVMWHNDTSNALTGTNAPINTLWWASGADKLDGRTIEVGPYKGERVYTLRQYLDTAKAKSMVPLIEIKAVAKQSLLNSNSTIKNQAWSEVLDPVKERFKTQEIMLYSHDSGIQAELVKRANAAGLESTISGGPQRPVWPDTVDWEEPPPSATGNYASWQTALDKAPKRMATSWPGAMKSWLNGKCS